MEAYDILKAFGEYVNYDPDQKQFNLLSSNYTYHQAGNRITTICDVYDPSGRMAVLYARCVYDDVISGERVKLHDLLLHPEAFDRELNMHKIFHSESVEKIESEYIEALNQATLAMTGRKVIGDRDLESEKKIMYDSIESVVEQLGSCREDVYITSGQPVGKINNISTKIHLFNYMAECVLTLQNNAPDGAYFCYINNNGTADGYFAIMIKSNGNLFSINDRVPEAYIGQHTNSRNNRWADGHKGIFPYEQIMTFGDHDYLGYARKYNIDESKLNLRDMDAKYYIPILLAIICVVNGRVGKVLDDQKLVYLNTLIRGNLGSGEGSTALIALDHTGLIVKTTQALEIHFDRDKFLAGGYAEEFTPRAGTKNQKLVDMYGQDFELKAKPLTMTATNALHSDRLTDGTDSGEKAVHAEFIGDINRMRRQAYYEARVELADHIRAKMEKELEAYGTTKSEQLKAVTKWFNDAMTENVKNWYPVMARLYRDALAIDNSPEHVKKDYHRKDDPEWIKMIHILDETDPFVKYAPHFNDAKWKLNLWGERMGPEYYLCPITGNRASIWFEFRAIDSNDVQHFIGNKELIRPLQNWHSSTYRRAGEDFFYGGNPILDAVDAVDFVESALNGRDYRVDFRYYIGFSKRGMNRLLKELAPSSGKTPKEE